MASLLVYSDHVPESVRAALQLAQRSSGATRVPLLETAARMLRDQAGVDCADARELVDLVPRECC